MHDVKLLPKQWEVFNPVQDVNYDLTLYQGGFGSGKTHLGSLVGLSVLSRNHGATWLVGADTGVRLKTTTCETYEELLDAASIRYRFNRTDKIIKILGWDEARVMFRGLDDPTALRSVNAIGGHLEEASLLTEMAYLEFLGRLRQAKDGQVIRAILTTNPQVTKGWLFDHFKTRGGITVENVRGRDVRISRRRVIASTLENRHVSDAFIATLQASYDPELFKIVVLGQDGDYTRGLVSYNFSDLNVRETLYKPELPVYLTCDFNVDPMSWSTVQRYNNECHFIKNGEIVIENTNINECIDEFCKRFPNHENGIIINGDASGNARNVQNDDVGGTSYTQMLNRFAKNGYDGMHLPKPRLDVREKNPNPADRVAAWNSKMCNTEGVRRIFIDPSNKWLIYNLENLKYKEGSGIIEEPTYNDIKKDPKLKFIKHIFDAASYHVEKYDPVIIHVKPDGPSVTVPKGLSKVFRR